VDRDVEQRGDARRDVFARRGGGGEERLCAELFHDTGAVFRDRVGAVRARARETHDLLRAVFA